VGGTWKFVIDAVETEGGWHYSVLRLAKFE
jgi:hypothetical protein